MSLDLPIIGTNLTVGQVAAAGQTQGRVQGMDECVAWHNAKKTEFLGLLMGTPAAWHAYAATVLKGME